VDCVSDVDGRWIPLRSNVNNKGSHNRGLRTGLSILVPGGGIIPGKQATVRSTQEVTVFVNRDWYVTVKK